MQGQAQGNEVFWCDEPSICVDSTERSSSPCIRLIVRRRASVTSWFAFMRASSLKTTLNLQHYEILKKLTQSFPPTLLSRRISPSSGTTPLDCLHSGSRCCVWKPARRCAILTGHCNTVSDELTDLGLRYSPAQVIVEPLHDLPKVMLIALSLLIINQNVQPLLPES